jgi:tungstate transport system permease protein
VLNTMLAVPSVVVGLVVYLLLSRSGPLGALGLAVHVQGHGACPALLVLPVVTALTRQLVEDAERGHGEQLRSIGAGPVMRSLLLAWDERYALLTVLMASFGRAISEVGAVMIVGGNIDGFTRVMTTAIALETSKGDLPLALALGLVLLAVVLALNVLIALLRRWRERVDGTSRRAAGGAGMSAVPSVNGAAPWPHVEMVTWWHAPSHPPVFCWTAWECAMARCRRSRVSSAHRAGRARGAGGANGSGKSTCCACCMGWQNPAAACCCGAMAAARPCCSSARTCCAPVPKTTWRWACGCMACAGARRAAGVAGIAAGRAGMALRHKTRAPVGRAAAAGGAGPCLGAAARCAAAGRAHLQPRPPCQARGRALMADFAASHGQAGPAPPVTMVFSSHNLGQVKRLASRVIYLEHGAGWPICPCTIFSTAPARGRPIVCQRRTGMKNFKSFWPEAPCVKRCQLLFL